jgi:CRP/FNR family cyclic AMP-dependent transcriptional regulator
MVEGRVGGSTEAPGAQLIAQSPLGEELTPAQQASLAALVKVRRVPTGAYLIEEGARDDSIHVVLKGVFEVVRTSGVGEPASLGMLRAGELAGEMSFIDGAEHQVGLRALADSEVFSLDRTDFERLVPRDPDVVYKVMRNIVRAVHERMRRMNLQYIELSNYIFKQHGRY